MMRIVVFFAAFACLISAQEHEGEHPGIELGTHEATPPQPDPTCDQGLTVTATAAALIAYAGVGDLDKVKEFLDQGLDPDSVDPEDSDLETALMRAASKNHHHVLKHLLDRGADRFRRDWEGKTALMIAATLGGKEALRELLEERPSAFDGSTELTLSGDEGKYEEMKDYRGRTALLWACYNAKADTAELLIERGVNLNAQDDTGRTPLMWAVTGANARGLAVTKLMLEAGADTAMEDHGGATALSWAVERGNKDLLTLVAKYQFGENIELMDS